MLHELVKHQSQLLKVAYNFTGDYDSANDILQDLR
jgi:DNA-directed RNA polymerase specialized sigma24 family protein